MRRNLLIGLCLTALVGLAAGDYLFNRSVGAQDAPKKAEPDEKKGDLFELLKKELDGKKESPTLPAPVLPTPTLPSLPPPNPIVPTAAQEKSPLPPVVNAPLAPLPLPVGKTDEPKPLAPQDPVISAPTPIAPPKVSDPLPPPSGPGFAQPYPIPGFTPPPLPSVNAQSTPVAPPPNGAFVTPSEPVKPKQDAAVKPAVGNNEPVSPRANVLPPAGSVPPNSNPPAANIGSIKEQSGYNAESSARPVLAKTTTSPWTLHIEIVDDMTIVTATVNKKHEFKVVCQNLEVMTGKTAFKASGKVKITGDSINGSCERLAISLTDDRLVLEGAAELQIQKTITQVSSDGSNPAAFELKGETLNLRISELQSGKFKQASFRKEEIERNPLALAPIGNEWGADRHNLEPMAPASKKEWSPYGKLRRVDGNWRLLDNAGRTILRIETTNGQLLENYQGRTISVFGPMVDRTTVRVTHIAVP